MNLLAFDTGTEVMSIAVARVVGGQQQLWQLSAEGGARASSELIPSILSLLQQADLRLNQLDAICFGCGPGSFTGLRTACCVAQGLAFGADVPVLPVDSLLAVAEDARYSTLTAWPGGVVTALLDARMDEMYCASFSFAADQWTPLQGSTLVRPEQLSAVTPLSAPLPWALAGNVFTVYGGRLAAPDSIAQVPRIAALPSAAAMLRLAPQLLAQDKAVSAERALPSYIRDKVAKTTAERMAEKAAAQAHVGT